MNQLEYPFLVLQESQWPCRLSEEMLISLSVTSGSNVLYSLNSFHFWNIRPYGTRRPFCTLYRRVLDPRSDLFIPPNAYSRRLHTEQILIQISSNGKSLHHIAAKNLKSNSKFYSWIILTAFPPSFLSGLPPEKSPSHGDVPPALL